MDRAAQGWRSRRWLIGGFLVAFGFLLLFMNMGVIARFPVWRFWPLVFIAAGIDRIFTTRQRATGFWLVVLGLWLQVSLLRVWGLHFGDTWPVMLIGFGIYLIWQSAEREAGRRMTKRTAESSSSSTNTTTR